MVLDGHRLNSELATGVSGAARAHCLRTEDVDLDIVAGCQLSKSDPVPPLLKFARLHQSRSFINLEDSYCNTIDTTYRNYRSVVRQ